MSAHQSNAERNHTAIPESAMEAAIRALHSDEWDTPELVIARAIMAAKAEQREADALIAERDADWSAFGKKDTAHRQWENGPDDARDYRIGICTGRAIAAAIRAGA